MVVKTKLAYERALMDSGKKLSSFGRAMERQFWEKGEFEEKTDGVRGTGAEVLDLSQREVNRFLTLASTARPGALADLALHYLNLWAGIEERFSRDFLSEEFSLKLEGRQLATALNLCAREISEINLALDASREPS